MCRAKGMPQNMEDEWVEHQKEPFLYRHYVLPVPPRILAWRLAQPPPNEYETMWLIGDGQRPGPWGEMDPVGPGPDQEVPSREYNAWRYFVEYA